MYINNLIAVKQLDIYDKVGKGVAHDEYIPFTVSKGQLHFESQHVRFSGSLSVQFVKVCEVQLQVLFYKLPVLGIIKIQFSYMYTVAVTYPNSKHYLL